MDKKKFLMSLIDSSRAEEIGDYPNDDSKITDSSAQEKSLNDNIKNERFKRLKNLLSRDISNSQKHSKEKWMDELEVQR